MGCWERWIPTQTGCPLLSVSVLQTNMTEVCLKHILLPLMGCFLLARWAFQGAVFHT